jgi:prepilin-type N-terminal cleavage/methylation domain-containing protein
MPVRLSASARRGFTLIEIMVALVIFSVLMTSLFASFRTGMQAYSMSAEHADQQQLGRFAINQVADDLHNIYYKPESQYNVARRQQEAMLDEQNANLRSASGRTDVIDENLPDLGPPVDLSFTGQDSGEIDQLSLVRSLPFSIENPPGMWGLGRITYYVIDGKLYRAIDDIRQPETDEDGNMIPKATRPQVEKLAENCVGFDLKYGYYYDEEFALADSWDSSASQYRNPETEEDDDVLGTMGENASDDVQSVGAAAALSQTLQQQQQQQRADDLPGWIELTFKFAPDMEKPEQFRTYKQTIVMNNKYAMETYVPEDEQDELKGARADSQADRRQDRNSSAASGSGSRSGSSGSGSRSSRGSR